MNDVLIKKQSKGCGLSFIALLIAGGTWLYFRTADLAARPWSSSARYRMPDKYGEITGTLRDSMIVVSVLLPLVLWALKREAYAKGTLKGIFIFWLLAGALIVAATFL